jgi:hypothetical protein
MKEVFSRMGPKSRRGFGILRARLGLEQSSSRVFLVFYKVVAAFSAMVPG